MSDTANGTAKALVDGVMAGFSDQDESCGIRTVSLIRSDFRFGIPPVGRFARPLSGFLFSCLLALHSFWSPVLADEGEVSESEPASPQSATPAAELEEEEAGPEEEMTPDDVRFFDFVSSEQLGDLGEKVLYAWDPRSYRTYWDRGLRIDRNDERFLLKVGGRLEIDAITASEDDDLAATIGEIGDDVFIRRGRLDTTVIWNHKVRFRMDYDLADEDVDLRDFYVEFPGPFGFTEGFRIGHFREPFSLENMTSGKISTFLERGLPFALVPRSNTGIALRDSILEDRLTWFLGGFFVTTALDDSWTQELAATARVTGLPLDRREEKQFLHLGLSGSIRSPRSEETSRLRTRPETGTGPHYVSTSESLQEDNYILGGELAWVSGPFSLQGEVVRIKEELSDYPIKDRSAYACYAFASYFLTGESRPYAKGVFLPVKPRRPFMGEDGGWGGWEVAARYSFIDLAEDPAPSAGKLADVTLGLNWHLRDNLRFRFNYVHAMVDRRDVEGSSDIFQARFQIYF